MTPKDAAATDPRSVQRSALEAARADARARVEALAAEVQAIVDASEGANLDDEKDPEGATVAFERQRVASLLDEARAQLVALDAAEDRLDDGTYGICSECGSPIPAERLEALPTTTRCIACARR